jgi:hypothetical protein
VKGLKKGLLDLVSSEAKRAKVELKETDPADTLIQLVMSLCEKNHDQKVAILIDDYGAPMIDCFDDSPKAEEIRRVLGRFYVALKTNGDLIGHILVTGELRLKKIALGYSLSGLRDISDHWKFGAICGFTAADLEDLLRDRLERTLEALIKRQSLPVGSDGNDLRKFIQDQSESYFWDQKTEIYSPTSVLSTLKLFRNFGSFLLSQENLIS